MKIIKRLLLTLTALVAVFAAAVLFVAANIDPNDYKDKIEAAAKQATGRELHIEGDIGLTLFPVLSLDIGQVSFDNPPGFEGRFASAERILARLDLLPLLQKRLEIGKITVQKPQLALYTASDGRTNWEDLAAASADAAAGAPSGDASGTVPLIAGFSLAGVAVEDATVIWRDARTGEHIRADAVALKTGALASGRPVELSLGGTVNDERRGLSADLDLDLIASVDIANQRAHAEKFTSKIEFRSGGAKPLDISVNADAALDLAADRAVIHHLSADIAGTHITGNADVIGLSEKAKITAMLKSDDLAPRTFAAALGVPADHLPEQAQFEVDATIDLAKDTGTFKKLTLAVGDARVKGAGSVTGLLSDNPGVNAKMESNTFDLRALFDALDLALPATADAGTFRRFAASGDLTADLGAAKGGATIRRSEVTLDDSRLRAQGTLAWLPTPHMKIDGELNRINAGRYLPPDDGDKDRPPKNIQVSDLRVQIRAAGGNTTVSVPAAKVFGGRMDGTLAMNAGSAANGQQPKWRSRGNAQGVKIEQVLAALAAEDEKLLKGTGALSWQLTAAGDDEEALTRSLAGAVKLELEKGAFNDPELARNIERVIAFFEKRPAGNTGGELIFNQAAASFSLKKGVAGNRDLKVDMPLLDIRGAGRIDLARSRVDYQLQVGLRERKPGKSPDEKIYIPIKITGALDDPKYSIDLQKALRKEARRQLKRKVKKEKEKIKDKVKDKLGEILKDGLKLPF